jgi:hypothetical protein
MKTIQQILTCALLAALTAMTISALLVVRAIPGELRVARTDLLSEMDATRRDLNRQLQSAITRSERQVAALRKDVMGEVVQFRETADRRLGDTLSRADTALGTVEALRRDLQPTLEHSAGITAQVNEALPLFLDCDHNPDCAFNRYVGVSRGIERAAQNFSQASTDVRVALPGMLSTWRQIGQSAAGTAGNLDRLTKPHWYDRLLGYGLNGVVIYRNLNPAANIPATGARIVSGRP